MKHFLIGVTVGVAAVLVAGFLLNPTVRYYLGSYLDEDIIHLKGGTVICGWITEENSEYILVKTKSDIMSVPRNICAAIYKNKPLHYMRSLM